jgi:hypothetical protein
MAERAGQPVTYQSWQLPEGLPAPFERFPVGAQRCFIVFPTDEIRLKPKGSEDSLMALSNLVAGKRNSIEQSGGGGQAEVRQPNGHAPCFAHLGQPEPNAISGERLRAGTPAPAAVPARSMIEARRRGLATPDTAGITQAEIDEADAELLAAEADDTSSIP